MTCEYCCGFRKFNDNHPKPLFNYTPRVHGLSGFIYKNYLIVLREEPRTPYTLISVTDKYKKKINYCPMCGRKLPVKENE